MLNPQPTTFCIRTTSLDPEIKLHTGKPPHSSLKTLIKRPSVMQTIHASIRLLKGQHIVLKHIMSSFESSTAHQKLVSFAPQIITIITQKRARNPAASCCTYIPIRMKPSLVAENQMTGNLPEYERGPLWRFAFCVNVPTIIAGN